VSVYRDVLELSKFEMAIIQAYQTHVSARDTLWWKLLSGIREGVVTDNSSASLFLYGNCNSDSRLSHAKNRLKFVIDSAKGSSELHSRPNSEKYNSIYQSIKSYLVSRNHFTKGWYEHERQCLEQAINRSSQGLSKSLSLFLREENLSRFVSRLGIDEIQKECNDLLMLSRLVESQLEFYIYSKKLSNLTNYLSDSCCSIPIERHDLEIRETDYESSILHLKVNASLAIVNKSHLQLRRAIHQLEEVFARYGLQNLSDRVGIYLLKGILSFLSADYCKAASYFLEGSELSVQGNINQKMCLILYLVCLTRSGKEIDSSHEVLIKEERQFNELYQVSCVVRYCLDGQYGDAYHKLMQVNILYGYKRTWRVFLRFLEAIVSLKLSMYDQYLNHIDSLRKLIYSINCPAEYKEAVLYTRKCLMGLQNNIEEEDLVRLRAFDDSLSYSCQWFVSFNDIADILIRSKE
jgi:hypothetical protein